MASENEGDAKRLEVRLDLEQLTEIINVGVRRASAFLKLGTQIGNLEIPSDMTLAGGVAFAFWPRDLSREVRESIREEFRAWLIGSCLRELDQCLGIFLDRAWIILEWAELHGHRIPSSKVLEFDTRFINDTNVARKLATVAEKAKVEVATECHNSLSLARNSLTHGHGQVRHRDCNRSDSLEVMWISPEMVIKDGDEEFVMRSEVFDTYQVKSPTGATVGVRFVRHSKTFKVGERLDFSAHELAEICFFYKQQADVTKLGIFEHLKTKGLTVTLVSDPTAIPAFP